MEEDGSLSIRTRPEPDVGDPSCTDASTPKEEADRVIARLVEKITALEEKLYVNELERTGMLLRRFLTSPWALASKKLVGQQASCRRPSLAPTCSRKSQTSSIGRPPILQSVCSSGYVFI